jgi:hypothetical protein
MSSNVVLPPAGTVTEDGTATDTAPFAASLAKRKVDETA